MEDRWRFAILRITNILVICACYVICIEPFQINQHRYTYYSKPGDFNFGGLFSFYQEVDGSCTTLNKLQGGIGRIEAMIYAIECINNNTEILPNITLGYSIYDDCGQESIGLASSLHMLGLERASCDTGIDTESNVLTCNKSPIIGIIGPEYTKVTIATNHLFSFYQVPHISASASSDELSDSDRFPFFSRLVPSDNFQVGAMIDIIEYFKWKYVSAVYSNEDYGEHGINELIDRSLKNNKFCLGTVVGVSEYASNSEVDRAIGQIVNKNVEVLVMFSLPAATQRFLDGMVRRNLIEKYTLILSDASIVFKSDPEYMKLLKGSLFINPYSSKKLPSFDKHIKEVAEAAIENVNSTDNTFLRAIINGCDSGMLDMCEELNRTLSNNFSLSTWSAIVMDAVNVMARALNSTLSDHPKGNSSEEFVFEHFYEHIIKTSFSGTRGLIQFMENGDFLGSYDIENFRQDGNQYKSKVVGQWNSQNETRLSFTEDIQWPFDHVPISICSLPCRAGQVIKVHSDNPLCCWECFDCREFEITSKNDTVCIECPEFHWPDVYRKSCKLVDPTFMRMSDPVAVLLLFLTTLGLSISLVTSVVYVHHREHSLIKASGREVMLIIMLGVYLSYIMVFFFVAKPDTGTCGVARVGLIMSFTWTYAPLLVKVFRINRIFHAAQKSPQKPKYIETSYQILFSILLISFQFIISIMWITIKEPRAVKENPVLYHREVTLGCNFQHGEIITSSIYNAILIGLCCFYAIRTRKLPDNFKETKFIGVSVYTTMFIFIAFIPSYFVVTEPVIRVAILSLAVIGNASTTLVCLFLSKLYAVYFVEEGNVPGTRSSGIPIGHTGTIISDNHSKRNHMAADDISTENVSVM